MSRKVYEVIVRDTVEHKFLVLEESETLAQGVVQKLLDDGAIDLDIGNVPDSNVFFDASGFGHSDAPQVEHSKTVSLEGGKIHSTTLTDNDPSEHSDWNESREDDAGDDDAEEVEEVDDTTATPKNA